VDELEQALLARWDRDTLLVYADALQARGDPRGELIALDLEIAERGVTTELALRRRRRLYEWLGGGTICDRPVHEASFRYGFATDFFVTHDRNADAARYLTALFASPAGRYVRGLTVSVGGPAQLQAAFAVIGSEPRPWLERLELCVVDSGAVLGDELVRVIAATPRLHTLALHGTRVLGTFAHPTVTTLVTEASQLPILESMPAVTTVDVSLANNDDDEEPEVVVARCLEARVAPSLRHLDLSRNEPIYPPQATPTVDVYPFARTLPLARLQTLRLPSLRAPHQTSLVQQMLDDAPALEIAIARTYTHHHTVVWGLWHAGALHPRLRLPTPREWPPRDMLSSREALTITVPTEEYGDDVSLTGLIERLEDQFDDLPPNARTAWLAFWSFLSELPWEDDQGHDVTKPYPAAALLTALEPLDDFVAYSGTAGQWAQLAEKLRAAELPPEAVVQVRRYWGW